MQQKFYLEDLRETGNLQKRLELYYTHQIMSRPVDRRLQTLQMLLGSGVLDELDSDMTHNILESVIK